VICTRATSIARPPMTARPACAGPKPISTAYGPRMC
jgi:hypothetical protein